MLKQIARKVGHVFPVPVAYLRACYWLFAEKESYLKTTGWLESLKGNVPLNDRGEAVPWMNYAIIRLLEARLTNDLSLFEYGSGFSTAFYARYVKDVISVEYDQSWYATIQQQIPGNAKVMLQAQDRDGQYCRTIQRVGGLYDVIVIDGRDRVNCLKQSLRNLSDRGVVLFDDSQRERYQDGIAHAREQGFSVLDFESLKPMGLELSRTSVIYRAGNCLGI